jgi:phosphoglycolate phosphatase
VAISPLTILFLALRIGGEADKDKKIELKSGPPPPIHPSPSLRTAQPARLAGFALEHDHDVGAVVVGFDRHINYYKIQYAQLCINENKGCQFIATNLDAVTHLTDAQEWAGNGSMAGAIKGCTGRDPTVVGKPAPLMIEYICSKYNLKPDRICMVPTLPA